MSEKTLSHEPASVETQMFVADMNHAVVNTATRNLGSSERVQFWSTFQPTANILFPSKATGRTVDDISAVLAGSKPATILLLTDLNEPLVSKLITEEANRFESLYRDEAVDYYGHIKYFWGKEENVRNLANLYQGRGGDDSPLPADEGFHRAVGEALGYPIEAIDAFIAIISSSKEHVQRKVLIEKPERPGKEYDPTLLDRVSGLIGRLGVRGAQQPEAIPEPLVGLSVNELLDTYESRNLIGSVLQPDSEEAKKLLAQFLRAPHLDKPIFIPDVISTESKRILSIDATAKKPVYLPVRDFVYAPGFESWNNGRNNFKFGTTSNKIIRSYARKRTPMPPIGFVSADIQPDGHVFYSAVQDGAHRIAAALLRGDETIPVGNTIIVNRLPKNIINT